MKNVQVMDHKGKSKEEGTKEVLNTPEENGNSMLENLKVLIAEDDKISSMLITRMLKSNCSKILHAENGLEAIELSKNNPDLDLILMDIRMPEMNGHEATTLIREFNPDIIIIAQTANSFSNDKEKALEAGCTDFISKPIRKNELYELIKKYVN